MSVLRCFSPGLGLPGPLAPGRTAPRLFRLPWLTVFASLGLLACSASESGSPEQRPNVLFISIDDLRPEIGAYGSERALTPQLDRFAASGVHFTRAFAQASLCTPSRTSVLTGYRPDSTGVVDLQAHFRDTKPDVVTLPQQFKNAGYQTVSVGKLFHKPDPESWSEPVFHPDRGLKYALAENRAPGRDARGPVVERPDVDDGAYRDGLVAQEAIETLRRLKDQPFFIAIGFFKPHLPFAAPKRFWDLYERDEIALPSNSTYPTDAPPFGLHPFQELRVHGGVPKSGPLGDELSRELIHGYLACVSYVDAQVGRVLDELEALGLAEQTIVCIWSDHGYYLGEHGLWCKMGVFDDALRVPLLVRAPGTTLAGGASAALVELVDVYPSLCELVGFPLPEHLEGTSFVPLLSEPDQPWKRGAFSQQANATAGVMGYSVRTQDLRFTSWRSTASPFGEVAAELYDALSDPGETLNVVGQPAYAERLIRMRGILDTGWEGARPN